MADLKQQLLGLATLRTKTVELDKLKVTVREAGATAFSEYGTILREQKDVEKANATLIADCVVDEDGNTIMTIEEAMPLAKQARTAVAIIGAVMELSGFAEADEKNADAG